MKLQLLVNSGLRLLIKMPTKHKKILEYTRSEGLNLIEDMNMMMFGFGPDADAYQKKKAKKKVFQDGMDGKI